MSESISLLQWVMSHTALYEYSEIVNYMKDDVVTIDNKVYQSLTDNNLGNNPENSPNWIKLI